MTTTTESSASSVARSIDLAAVASIPSEMTITTENYGNGYIQDIHTGKKYNSMLDAYFQGNHYSNLKVEWCNDTRLNDELWSTPININLKDLYRQRIHYLRNRFDYLELSWSGGHDSNYILQLAREENIKFDAISMRSFGDNITDESNFMVMQNYELRHNKPHLDIYLKKFTDVHIIYDNVFELYKTSCDNFNLDAWAKSGASNVELIYFGYYYDVSRRNIKKNDTAGLLVGSEKPAIVYNDRWDSWQHIFTSRVGFNHPSWGRRRHHEFINYGTNINDVKLIRFYTEPENNWQIVRKQCHVIKDYCKKNLTKNGLTHFKLNLSQYFDNAIYSDLELPVVSLAKTTYNNYHDYHKCSWIWNSKYKKHVAAYFDFLDELEKRIDPDNLIIPGKISAGFKDIIEPVNFS
jgi:hypothetical protein